MKREPCDSSRDHFAQPSSYHPLTGLLAVHETLGNGVRGEDLIPGAEQRGFSRDEGTPEESSAFY